jgi:Uncharacterised nucleotidyltransferase
MAQKTTSPPPLTPEERYLWDCARHWRTPARLEDPTIPSPGSTRRAGGAGDALDWARVIAIGKSNRLLPLLNRVLAATGQLGVLPAEVRQMLEVDASARNEAAAHMGQALQRYLRLAAARGLDTVVLKGLSLSVNIYGDPAMRPGGDIDLLVRRHQIGQSLAILDEMGLGRWWPNLLDDAYYDRHHLHQQRCTPDLKIWFEPHWALDHPYTLLTVDYEAMMDRARPGELLGQPVCDLAPPDLLLSVAVHLVKHAIYLSSVLNRPDLSRIILADGMLINYLDAAEVIKVNAGVIDWSQVVELAEQSGTRVILGSVLRVCFDLLQSPVPEWVLAALPVTGPGGLTRHIMTGMADQELAAYLGGQQSRLWGFLVITNGAFILRPIRILDTIAYIFPPREFLQRRYGDASLGVAWRHLLHAGRQYGRLGIDTVYYTWERYRRLKALNQSASLFNRLDSPDQTP